MKYMDMALTKEENQAEKERYLIWMQYLTQIYSQRPQEKEPPQLKQARKDFVQAIKPMDKSKPKEKVYQWDFERLKKLQQQQKGG
ncbi:hypothetical protein [Bacillus suaedae]|uniref:Uncharacterized protein n=1 Tax=Halalkalibacter suaedae TaxID=2822140 RepID=A0A940WTH3_9BACI|nr:hypothetical protein [Bacillus suaedae]MBP3950342.1 hypothetical protein [Bacillus suaedae]